MADPEGYDVGYSFGDFQSNSPSTPLPGQKLDIELMNIALAVSQLVLAVKDVRREDGQLRNGSVHFDSLDLALQLMLDPTNADLVASAVAAAQAAAQATALDRIASAANAADAETSAAEAAASAATVNLALYLPKAGNLAGIGNPDTALANIHAAKDDGTNMNGRLASQAAVITNWNNAVENGWYVADGAPNSPPLSGTTYWLGHVIATGAVWVTQILYPFLLGATSTAAVTPYRRQGYDTGSGVAWQPWQPESSIPVGASIYVNGTTAPPGFLKENGALLTRSVFKPLFDFANTSGQIVSEASWLAGYSGAFSFGDLSTTFRLPEGRAEFIRGLDNGRGVDVSRVPGSNQADGIISHQHTVNGAVGLATGAVGSGGPTAPINPTTTVADFQVGGLNETRPKNIPKLLCIKY